MEADRVLFELDGQEFRLGAAMDFLGSIPILQQLPAGLIKRVAESIRPVHFAPGEKLVQVGEPGEGFYIIWKGQAEVVPPAESGIVGNVLKPGDYFGSACPSDQLDFHKADVVAVDEVICLVLPHEHHELVSSDSIWTKPQKDAATVQQILELEKLEVDLFRGFTIRPSIHGRVFGGQFIGQALAAASKSVDPSLLVHSLHSYFLRVGDESVPIIYQVERVRDGHRFATRQVTAKQKGQDVFMLIASFQKEEESMEHQDQMPDAPSPDKMLPAEVIVQRYLVDPRIPLALRKKLGTTTLDVLHQVLDVRPCDPIDELNHAQAEVRQRLWIRAREKLADDQALHRCAAAFASDYGLAGTVVRPHKTEPRRGFRMLSLDHSLFFHRPFRADEWLLYTMTSPVTREGRGLAIGHMYTQSGKLVVTAVQECVFRAHNRVVSMSKL